MSFLLGKIRTYFEVRELQILSGQKMAGPWRRIWTSIVLVGPYWIIAFVILVVSLALKLLLVSSLPLTLGGILLSLEGVLFGFYICPDTMVLNTLETFSKRLRKMGVGKFTDRAKVEDGFRERERHRGRFLRWFANATSLFFFFSGIVIAFFSEAL